jgi:hypothetical protein
MKNVFPTPPFRQFSRAISSVMDYTWVGGFDLGWGEIELLNLWVNIHLWFHSSSIRGPFLDSVLSTTCSATHHTNIVLLPSFKGSILSIFRSQAGLKGFPSLSSARQAVCVIKVDQVQEKPQGSLFINWPNFLKDMVTKKCSSSKTKQQREHSDKW